MMFRQKSLEARKEKLPITGRWCFNLFIESVLIIGGTLGDDVFFSTIANLTKTACSKNRNFLLRLTVKIVAMFLLRLTQNNTK